MARSAQSREIYAKWRAGMSIRTLAAEYKLSYIRVQTICATARAQVDVSREAHRERQLALIELAIEPLIPAAEAGNVKAIRELRGLIETHARITGTQAPKQVHLSGAGGEPLFTPDDQRRALTPAAIAALQAYEQTVESNGTPSGHPR